MAVNSRQGLCAWLGCGAAVRIRGPSPGPRAAHAPPRPGSSTLHFPLNCLVTGIRGLDGSLRDWSEVLQTELSIRILTRAGRESGASARWR